MPGPDTAAEPTTFSMTVQATTHALGRLVSVLQTRGSQIIELTWTVPPGHHTDPLAQVTVVVALKRPHPASLHKAMARLVDVLDIKEQPNASTATH